MVDFTYFLDRVCTVLTGPIGLHITDPVRHAQYFTGKVISVDDSGIWLEHLQAKTMAYFSLPVVGILEEQFIPEDDPRSDKIKKELEKKKEQPRRPLPPPQGMSQYIPLDQLTKVVKEGKNKV